MSTQVRDVVWLNNQSYVLLEPSEEILIELPYGLPLVPAHSGLMRGYHASYEVLEQQLLLRELMLRMPDEHSEPPHWGGTLEALGNQLWRIQQLAVPASKNARLVLARHYEPEPDAKPDYANPPWRYREVLELQLQDGKVSAPRAITEEVRAEHERYLVQKAKEKASQPLIAPPAPRLSSSLIARAKLRWQRWRRIQVLLRKLRGEEFTYAMMEVRDAVEWGTWTYGQVRCAIALLAKHFFDSTLEQGARELAYMGLRELAMHGLHNHAARDYAPIVSGLGTTAELRAIFQGLDILKLADQRVFLPIIQSYVEHSDTGLRTYAAELVIEIFGKLPVVDWQQRR